MTNWKPTHNGLEAKSYLPGCAEPIRYIVFRGAGDCHWRTQRHHPDGTVIEFAPEYSEAGAMARCEREANK